MNRGLQKRLVKRFLPLALEHLPEHTAADKFEILKGYPMRAYSLSQVGKQVFDATFDHHVALQEEHYLKDHNLAKAHGKKKTSNLRFSFHLHLLDEARKGHRGDTWGMEVSEDSVNCGNDIGEFYNLISDKTEAFLRNSSLPTGVFELAVGGSFQVVLPILAEMPLLLRTAQVQRTP